MGSALEISDWLAIIGAELKRHLPGEYDDREISMWDARYNWLVIKVESRQVYYRAWYLGIKDDEVWFSRQRGLERGWSASIEYKISLGDPKLFDKLVSLIRYGPAVKPEALEDVPV